MQNIKTDFGFKNIRIGNTVIYTGKIRIKESESFLRHKLQNYTQLIISEREDKNYQSYSTITFETANPILNQQLIASINSVLAEIMHSRITAKYAPRVSNKIEVSDFEYLDLPY